MLLMNRLEFPSKNGSGYWNSSWQEEAKIFLQKLLSIGTWKNKFFFLSFEEVEEKGL